MMKKTKKRYVIAAAIGSLGLMGIGGAIALQYQNTDTAYAEEAAAEKAKTGTDAEKSKDNDPVDAGKTKAPKNDFHHYLESPEDVAGADTSTIKIQLSQLPKLFEGVYPGQAITAVELLPHEGGYEYLVTAVKDGIDSTAEIDAGSGQVLSKFSDEAKVSSETGSSTPLDLTGLTSLKAVDQAAEKAVGNGTSKIWRLTTIADKTTWEVGVLKDSNEVTMVKLDAATNTVLK